MSEKQVDMAPGALTISDADFKRLVTFVHSKYGVDLRQKRQLVTSRLGSTVREKGFKNFSEYVDYMLKRASSEDIDHLMTKLTTNYTYFMREPEAFNYFVNHILPELAERHRRDKVLSLWSAACSSGEEPYNVTMYMMDYFGAQAAAWDTRMLASDLSVDALSKAKRGVYELPDTVPAKWKRDYFTPAGNGLYAVAPKIKNNVIFKQFNLMEPIRFRRKFDVIFCRNVMIYFDLPTKKALVERLYEATVPGGYLIISLSENLTPDAPYRRVATSIFKKV